MYAGRVGLVTVALALAFRDRGRQYSYPEERPLVG
jgi:trk system potassium uptake protein TrkH